MSTAVPAGPGKNTAVAAVGLITMLWGAIHAVAGGCFIFAGIGAIKKLDDDPAGGLAFLLQAIFGFVAAVGIAFLLQGVLGLLAGWGVLSRKPWGRNLTFVVAVLAILWGLLSLSVSAEGASYVAAGVAEILYGLFAVFILSKEAAAFSGPRG